MTTQQRRVRSAPGGRKTRRMPHEISLRMRYWINQRGGWSQLERKLRAGGTTVTESTMSRLLNGVTEPKLGTLLAIADALEVSVHELLPQPQTGVDGVAMGVPMASWSDGELALEEGRKGVLLDSRLLADSEHLVALRTQAANMRPHVEPGDILILGVDEATRIVEGTLALIADPATGAERLLWVHGIAQSDAIQFSGPHGVVVGPSELVKGRVHLVLHQPKAPALEVAQVQTRVATET